MTCLVCGGRRYADVQKMREVLSRHLARGDTLIHGDAAGADRLAGRVALELGCTVREFPADWKRHGRGAGPVRNQRMLDEGRPDLVIAFPGGTGTADMTRRALVAGVALLKVHP